MSLDLLILQKYALFLICKIKLFSFGLYGQYSRLMPSNDHRSSNILVVLREKDACCLTGYKWVDVLQACFHKRSRRTMNMFNLGAQSLMWKRVGYLVSFPGCQMQTFVGSWTCQPSIWQSRNENWRFTNESFKRAHRLHLQETRKGVTLAPQSLHCFNCHYQLFTFWKAEWQVRKDILLS